MTKLGAAIMVLCFGVAGWVDWWVWRSLANSSLERVGELIAFLIAAVISIPLTIFLIIFGLGIWGFIE